MTRRSTSLRSQPHVGSSSSFHSIRRGCSFPLRRGEGRTKEISLDIEKKGGDEVSSLEGEKPLRAICVIEGTCFCERSVL